MSGGWHWAMIATAAVVAVGWGVLPKVVRERLLWVGVGVFATIAVLWVLVTFMKAG